MCEIFYGAYEQEGVLGLCAEGHAGPDEKGQNTVCAAVTSLLRALICALNEEPGSERQCLVLERGQALALVQGTQEEYRRHLPQFLMIRAELERLAADYPDRVRLITDEE